jgi:hypothetical protein
LISWKDSFEKINNELNLAKRKQNALEELHTSGKISQLTYENLNRALTAEIEQIEARRKALAEKMTSKLNELEKQISTLETFLANVEMSYAAGEITEEIHNQEVNALNLGLEATKNELNFIKEAIMQLVPEETQAELAATIETPETVEETPTETVSDAIPEATPPETSEETMTTEETSIEEQPIETVETPETPEAPEIQEAQEEVSKEETETLTEELTEQAVTETPTEEITTEEQTLSETPLEETTLEEPETPETPETSETVETPTEESQPFQEETTEES